MVGGGIGGLAAALALTRQGVEVQLLEQASRIGEIGAGIKLGPNAFAALDALGVGRAARAVFTDHIIMMDAVDAREVVRIDTGETSAPVSAAPSSTAPTSTCPSWKPCDRSR